MCRLSLLHLFCLASLFSISYGLNARSFQEPLLASVSPDTVVTTPTTVQSKSHAAVRQHSTSWKELPNGNRRKLFQLSSVAASGLFFFSILSSSSWLLSPTVAGAMEVDNVDPQQQLITTTTTTTTTIRLQTRGDSLGLKIGDSTLRGKPIVIIQQVVKPNPINRQLKEGMILRGYESSQQVLQRLQNGPYPLNLEFRNLAAGGDALDDLGDTIVTPKDALRLAQQTESTATSTTAAAGSGGGGSSTTTPYSITTLRKATGTCAIQSRRGDVLELVYEASYVNADGTVQWYDSSTVRGTGQQPSYQIVLGSGDMIPGVDQGLYDMCPGDERQLQIPPILAYGQRARTAFGIPDTYQSLQWKVKLISIDSTIRENNNRMSRDDRESRAPYY